MRTAVTIRVPYPEAADAGDGVQVYTDFGTGTIDLTKPLLSRPGTLFRGARRRFAGHGTEIYGESSPGTGRQPARAGKGHGSEIHGVTAYGATPAFLDVGVSVPPAYASWKFQARLVDALGNVQGTPLPEVTVVVSSVHPPGLASFEFASLDSTTRQASFSFTRNTE